MAVKEKEGWRFKATAALLDVVGEAVQSKIRHIYNYLIISPQCLGHVHWHAKRRALCVALLSTLCEIQVVMSTPRSIPGSSQLIDFHLYLTI